MRIKNARIKNLNVRAQTTVSGARFDISSLTNWANATFSGTYSDNDTYISFSNNNGTLTTDAININTLSTNDYTYEFWVRTTGTEAGALLTKIGTGGYVISAVEIAGNNTLVPGYYTGSAAYLPVSTPITRDEWQHYTVTYNTTDGYLKTYFDGALVATMTLGTELSPRDTGFSDMYFTLFAENGYGFGNSAPLTGDLGEFRLYTRALTAAEVAQNYRATLPRWRLPTGLSSNDPSTSAWAIKQAYPDSADGRYWIQNDNINDGEPFRIYADMTTDGGGWTLIMQNNNDDWSTSNAMLRNSTSPPASLAANNVYGNGSENYSIIGWADSIKRSASGFEYMLEAGSRGSNGGIWTANEAYSFSGEVDSVAYISQGSSYFGSDVVAGSTGFRQNVTLTTKFGTWEYANDGLERRMPWFNNSDIGIPGIVTTTHDDAGSWWGTIMGGQNGYFAPAPYIQQAQNPQVIWYWVR